jgi:hypothetical protein
MIRVVVANLPASPTATASAAGIRVVAAIAIAALAGT